MLALIGIGLAEPGDVSVKGYNIAKQSDKIYLESYTSKLACSHEELEKFYGKKILLANRTFVEDGKQLLSEAQTQNVALLVIGDPLCATTHWDILTRAKEQGILTRVVHNASIMNAIGVTGLQVYKFGKTTSIPFPTEKFEPETAYDVILQNKAIGAHTLILLDLRPDENRYMSVNEAIEILRKIDRRRDEHGLTAGDWCVGIARLGFPDQKIVAGTVIEVSDVNFGPAPHALIVPAKLHFLEEEALAQWGAKRKDRKAKIEIWEN